MSMHDVLHALRQYGGAKARRAFGVALLGLACCVIPSRALAEEAASDRATARALAGEGYAALRKKDYETAEDRFRRANELVHAPTLVVDHARSLVGLGRLGEAYQAYASVLTEDVPENAPWVWKKAVSDAETELTALKPRVAWLTVTVNGPLTPSVTIDGRSLPDSALGTRTPADPGTRQFVASAAGFITQEGQLVLTAGTDSTLDLELLAEPKPEPVVVRAAPVLPPTRTDGGKNEHAAQAPVYASFAVAGVGLATGIVAGILWMNARSDIVSECGGLTCASGPPDVQSRREQDKHRYDTLGTISGVGFAVSVVGAAAGVTFLVLRPKAEAASQSMASLMPYVGPTSVGLRGTFQ